MIQATTAYPKSREAYRQEQEFETFRARLRANVKAEIHRNLQKQKST